MQRLVINRESWRRSLRLGHSSTPTWCILWVRTECSSDFQRQVAKISSQCTLVLLASWRTYSCQWLVFDCRLLVTIFWFSELQLHGNHTPLWQVHFVSKAEERVVNYLAIPVNDSGFQPVVINASTTFSFFIDEGSLNQTMITTMNRRVYWKIIFG